MLRHNPVKLDRIDLFYSTSFSIRKFYNSKDMSHWALSPNQLNFQVTTFSLTVRIYVTLAQAERDFMKIVRVHSE